MNKFIALAATLIVIVGCNPQQTTPPAQPDGQGAAIAPVPGAEGRSTGEAANYAVVSWGQQSTIANESFNVQQDGNSGLSFELNQPAPYGEIRATFDGKPLTSIVANGVIVTATIPDEYISTPGKYPVELILPASTEAVVAGDFEVK